MTNQSSIFCWKPILRRGACFRTSSDRSLTAPRSSSLWRARRSTLARSSFNSAETVDAASRYSRTCTKARMMAMLAAMATSLFYNPESIATPCSVKAYGRADLGLFDVITICDESVIHSSSVNWNIKSGGNLLRFLLTDWFSTRVSTWYSLAKSKSNITFSPETYG